jgi:hypothetical protein
MKGFNRYMLIVMLLGYVKLSAQDTLSYIPEQISYNVDSLIRDSVRKAYILNHIPLRKSELDTIKLVKAGKAYGKWTAFYMENIQWFLLKEPADRLYLSRREHEGMEWQFYSFSLLFLLASFLVTGNRNYIKNIFKIYGSDGYAFRQARDFLQQSPLTSVGLNIQFLLTAALFVYFGFGSSLEQVGMDRLGIVIAVITILLFVYSFKYIFLQILGWIFKAKGQFQQYQFVVLLNLKIAGWVFLISAFLMAFSAPFIAGVVFNLALAACVLILLFRIWKGYMIFARQAQVNLFIFLMSVLSFEVLPAAVFAKIAYGAIESWFNPF